MQVSVTPDEFVAAFARDWPLQHEITALRLVTEGQARRIAELEGGVVHRHDDAGSEHAAG